MRNYSTSVNPIDWKIRSDTAGIFPAKLPKVRKKLMYTTVHNTALTQLSWRASCSSTDMIVVQIIGGDLAGIVEEADASSKVLAFSWASSKPAWFAGCFSGQRSMGP